MWVGWTICPNVGKLGLLTETQFAYGLSYNISNWILFVGWGGTSFYFRINQKPHYRGWALLRIIFNGGGARKGCFI